MCINWSKLVANCLQVGLLPSPHGVGYSVRPGNETSWSEYAQGGSKTQDIIFRGQFPCQFALPGVWCHWVSVKPGLWTGLDYGQDWTVDWTGLTKTAVYRQQTSPRLQKLVPSSASSCFLAVESSRHRLLNFREVKGHVHI